jgi:hypothetical protein
MLVAEEPARADTPMAWVPGPTVRAILGLTYQAQLQRLVDQGKIRALRLPGLARPRFALSDTLTLTEGGQNSAS